MRHLSWLAPLLLLVPSGIQACPLSPPTFLELFDAATEIVVVRVEGVVVEHALADSLAGLGMLATVAVQSEAPRLARGMERMLRTLDEDLDPMIGPLIQYRLRVEVLATLHGKPGPKRRQVRLIGVSPWIGDTVVLFLKRTPLNGWRSAVESRLADFHYLSDLREIDRLRTILVALRGEPVASDDLARALIGTQPWIVSSLVRRFHFDPRTRLSYVDLPTAPYGWGISGYLSTTVLGDEHGKLRLAAATLVDAWVTNVPEAEHPPFVRDMAIEVSRSLGDPVGPATWAEWPPKGTLGQWWRELRTVWTEPLDTERALPSVRRDRLRWRATMDADRRLLALEHDLSEVLYRVGALLSP